MTLNILYYLLLYLKFKQIGINGDLGLFWCYLIINESWLFKFDRFLKFSLRFYCLVRKISACITLGLNYFLINYLDVNICLISDKFIEIQFGDGQFDENFWQKNYDYSRASIVGKIFWSQNKRLRVPISHLVHFWKIPIGLTTDPKSTTWIVERLPVIVGGL